MSQTAERLIDKLQLAVFNADAWGVVELQVQDAKDIASHLRTLIGMDEISTRCQQMALTRTEVILYRALVSAGDRPVSPRELVKLTNCKTLGSLWVHKRRLQVKLQAHGAGDIDTVRGRGYRFAPAGGEE